MVYALIGWLSHEIWLLTNRSEQLNEYLQTYNEDVKYGYFGMLSDEVIYRVFEYLRPEDIGRLSLVNKTLNRIANDSSVNE